MMPHRTGGPDPRPGAELVEVIDEHGQVLSVVTRAEMRARHLRHRCVYLLVVGSEASVRRSVDTPARRMTGLADALGSQPE